MVFGTFDLLHKGHENLFRQARRLAKRPYLIVSLGRDMNAASIKNRRPLHNEKARLNNVRKHPLVDKAVLGAKTDYLGHIFRQQPQIIALGYDQTHYTRGLRQKLARLGLKVRVRRMKPYKAEVYKSSLLAASRNA